MPSTCKDQSDVALNSDKWVFEVLGACPWTEVPQSTPILAQIWWILTGSRANVKAPVVVLGPWRHGTERCPPPIPTGLRRICSCPAGCHYPCGSLQGDAGSQAPSPKHQCQSLLVLWKIGLDPKRSHIKPFIFREVLHGQTTKWRLTDHLQTLALKVSWRQRSKGNLERNWDLSNSAHMVFAGILSVLM